MDGLIGLKTDNPTLMAIGFCCASLPLSLEILGMLFIPNIPNANY
jgi:hypothetical protein